MTMRGFALLLRVNFSSDWKCGTCNTHIVTRYHGFVQEWYSSLAVINEVILGLSCRPAKAEHEISGDFHITLHHHGKREISFHENSVILVNRAHAACGLSVCVKDV